MAKKRGQNEGTIFQREDGRWVSRISLGYDLTTNKRKQKTFYGKTKDEVRRKLTEAQRGNDLGLNIAPKTQTVEQFLTHWLEQVAKQRVRPATYRSYEQIIRNHLVPGLGKYSLQKLTPQIVQNFLNAKAETGISVEHIRRVLRTALTQAVRWDLVPRNVATLVSTPKKERHEFTYLPPEKAKAFLEAAKSQRLEALFTVAVAVGLRLGEALGLRWQDIDLDGRTLTVRHQLQRLSGKPQLVEPKTSKARRTVPLPQFAVNALIAHKARQAKEKEFNADTWNDQDFVFTSSIGTPVDDRNIRKTLNAILAKCELPHMRFHDLRHTCASLLLAQGTDPRTIMETLGHSQITLTLNTYSHVLPSLQRDAADRMQQLIGE
jgi:integrase